MKEMKVEGLKSYRRRQHVNSPGNVWMMRGLRSKNNKLGKRRPLHQQETKQIHSICTLHWICDEKEEKWSAHKYSKINTTRQSVLLLKNIKLCNLYGR